MSKLWDDTKYKYAFNTTVNNLKQECFVCRTKKNVGPHHLRHVKKSDELYSDESNIVILCEKHHREYHKQYPEANPKTFAEFARNYERNLFNKLIKKYEKNLMRIKDIRKASRQLHKVKKKNIDKVDMLDKFVVLYNLGCTVDLIKSLLNINQKKYQDLFKESKILNKIIPRGRGRNPNELAKSYENISDIIFSHLLDVEE